MTKKELEILVKEQSKQISDLISLVQNQKKETIIVREPVGNKDWKPSQPYFPSPWTPTSPINPWVTYCGTGTGNYTSSSSTEPEQKSKRVSSTNYSNEPLCVMDSCLGNEVTASELDKKETQAAKDLSTIYSNAAIF